MQPPNELPFFSLPIMWYPPFCPYCLASVYNLLGDTRQGFLSIFSTSPPHIHGSHGNLSDSPLAALELYVKKDKTLIFR
jgi:hypothetical protein